MTNVRPTQLTITFSIAIFHKIDTVRLILSDQSRVAALLCSDIGTERSPSCCSSFQCTTSRSSSNYPTNTTSCCSCCCIRTDGNSPSTGTRLLPPAASRPFYGPQLQLSSCSGGSGKHPLQQKWSSRDGPLLWILGLVTRRT